MAQSWLKANASQIGSMAAILTVLGGLSTGAYQLFDKLFASREDLARIDKRTAVMSTKIDLLLARQGVQMHDPDSLEASRRTRQPCAKRY